MVRLVHRVRVHALRRFAEVSLVHFVLARLEGGSSRIRNVVGLCAELHRSVRVVHERVDAKKPVDPERGARAGSTRRFDGVVARVVRARVREGDGRDHAVHVVHGELWLLSRCTARCTATHVGDEDRSLFPAVVTRGVRAC